MYQLTEENKKIRNMFSAIAGKYDFLNHLLSLNIDKKWRRTAVNMIDSSKDFSVLDMATGTGDVAVEIMRQSTKKANIVGVDLNSDMLKYALLKTKEKKKSASFNFMVAPAESIPIKDNTFDYCTIAFGIRNVPDKVSALKEMLRVLKPKGRLIVLELTKPKNKLFGASYNFYFFKILPTIGGIISKKKSAWKYLPSSVKRFPSDEEFMGMMAQAGFKEITVKSLTFGIASIYSGVKEAK